MASVGSTLRLAREQRGLTIEQVAQDTRISQRFLEAIERDEFDALPAPVYVRGFIRSYSSYLRLDAAPLLAELALQGLGGAPATTLASPGTQQEPPPVRGPSEERRPIDPFARPTSPRAPEPDRAAEVPSPPPPPERASPAPPPPPRPTGPPGRPTPPPPIPPDALDDSFAREPAPFLRAGDDDDQRTSRIFAIVAAVFFGVIGVGALAFVFTRGGDGDEPTVVTDTPTPRTDASVVPVPTGTRSSTAATSSPAASPSPTSSGTPGTPGSTQTPGSSSGEPTPTVGSSGSTPGSTETSVPTSLPTQVPTSVPTSVPTPTPTVTPFPTPTQIGPIINHPFGLYECEQNRGDCGSFPRRVICAPDGWFVDVERDWGDLPIGWRETYVEVSGSGPLVAAGEGRCL